jgi:general secretion pathway protein G
MFPSIPRMTRIALMLSALCFIFMLMLPLYARKALEGRRSITLAEVKQLEPALEAFKKMCGTYPSTQDGLSALARGPSDASVCPGYPAQAFLKDGKIPKDGFGKPLRYTSNGQTYHLSSGR